VRDPQGKKTEKTATDGCQTKGAGARGHRQGAHSLKDSKKRPGWVNSGEQVKFLIEEKDEGGVPLMREKKACEGKKPQGSKRDGGRVLKKKTSNRGALGKRKKCGKTKTGEEAGVTWELQGRDRRAL